MSNRIISYNPKLKELARKLRKEGSPGEIRLWQYIKNKSAGVEFHRQVPIDNYIVDFYCHEIKLAIEVDGNSHTGELAYQRDMIRSEKLQSLGITIIRFWESEVKNDITNVLRDIEGAISMLQNTSPFEGG